MPLGRTTRITWPGSAPPVTSGVQPPMGSREGGTLVRVVGINLGGGSIYRCRFGELEPVPAELT